MSLLLTLMDLDKLYESNEPKVWLDRRTLINNIKNSGRDYNFDRYSDEGLFRIWERIQKEDEEAAAIKEYQAFLNADRHKTCPECGMRLNDGGTCAICDHGEEDY